MRPRLPRGRGDAPHGAVDAAQLHKQVHGLPLPQRHGTPAAVGGQPRGALEQSQDICDHDGPYTDEFHQDEKYFINSSRSTR
jgi:hypothetical protein